MGNDIMNDLVIFTVDGKEYEFQSGTYTCTTDDIQTVVRVHKRDYVFNNDNICAYIRKAQE